MRAYQNLRRLSVISVCVLGMPLAFRMLLWNRFTPSDTRHSHRQSPLRSAARRASYIRSSTLARDIASSPEDVSWSSGTAGPFCEVLSVSAHHPGCMPGRCRTGTAVEGSESCIDGLSGDAGCTCISGIVSVIPSIAGTDSGDFRCVFCRSSNSLLRGHFCFACSMLCNRLYIV